MSKLFKWLRYLFLVGVSSMPMLALASTTGDEFKALAEKVEGWVNGYLGMTIALFALLIGIGMSIAKSNIMPAVFGVLVAITATMGPDIVKSMFTVII